MDQGNTMIFSSGDAYAAVPEKRSRKKWIVLGIIAGLLVIAGAVAMVVVVGRNSGAGSGGVMISEEETLGMWGCSDGSSILFARDNVFYFSLTYYPNAGRMTGKYMMSNSEPIFSEIKAADEGGTIEMDDYRYVGYEEGVLSMRDGFGPAIVACQKKWELNDEQ